MSSLTPKRFVRGILPEALIDYYETIPGFVFVRSSIQGDPVGALCRTPRQAWLAAKNAIVERAQKAGAR